MIETINKLNRLSRDILQKRGEEPLAKDIAEEMVFQDILGKTPSEESKAAVEKLRETLQEKGRGALPEKIVKSMNLTEGKVRKVLKIAKEPISMEMPIGDNEDSHLGDFIEDKNIKAPVDIATAFGLKSATDEILESLTEREAKVLQMRFGIGMNTDHTLEEVGKQFDVTRERIRQIEAKALRKLRHPSRSEHLKGFLDGT